MGLGIRSTIGLVLFAIWAKRQYLLFGFHHDELIDRHFDDFECNLILKGTGAEDIVTTHDGLAFITSGLMYPPYSFKRKEGKIFVTNLEESPVKLLETKIVATKNLDLNPHGIDLIELDGRILIYVINHKGDLSEESVEKFEYKIETNELIWLKSIVSPVAFRSLNDVAVVGEDEFYATNDKYFSLRNPILRNLENYALFRLGSLVHCKLDNCSIVSSYNLAMPNGISIRKTNDQITGKTKTEVLVVYCYDMGVGVYEIMENGDLNYKQMIPAPATMDNMWIGPDGTTYIAGHPAAWKFLLSVWFPEKAKTYPPGSEVLKMAPGSYEFEQIYLDNGRQFIASSIAVFWKNNILMGSPTANLMECHKIK